MTVVCVVDDGTIGLVRPRLKLVKNEPPSAEQLLQAAGRGDEAAFGALYDQLGAMIYGIVLRVIVDPAMAEEVTQEVFVDLWRNAASFDPTKGKARSWCATVAHRRAVDRVRSEQARRDREDADHQATPQVEVDLVSEAVASKEERTSVHEALDQLVEGQREAVTLAYFGGKTYREVAAHLGIPEGTAKTRIRDGLIRLRDMMGVLP